MDMTRFTRRDVLRSGAALAMAPAVASISAAGQTELPAQWPVIGVSTLGFGEYTNRQLAQEFAAENVRTIQLFLSQSDSQYWVYSGRSDVSAITPDRAREIANEYRSVGIDIHSIGVYTNLIHPDPAERAANLDYFEAMMHIGERFAGRFRRVVSLPDDIDAGAVTAQYRDGVLHVRVPRREAAQPRRIAIQ